MCGILSDGGWRHGFSLSGHTNSEGMLEWLRRGASKWMGVVVWGATSTDEWGINMFLDEGKEKKGLVEEWYERVRKKRSVFVFEWKGKTKEEVII